MQQLIHKAFRIAQRAYYWSFGAIAIAGICGYLLSRLVQCDRALGLAIALQSVVYMVLLISLPAILWWFHRQVEKFKLITFCFSFCLLINRFLCVPPLRQ